MRKLENNRSKFKNSEKRIYVEIENCGFKLCQSKASQEVNVVENILLT